MPYETVELHSVSDLLADLANRVGEDTVWYRGHRLETWELLPWLLRDPAANILPIETAALNKFRQDAGRFMDVQPLDDWEWLFHMQHYGVPTRLLDWTESPLVGLYFAVREPAEPGGATTSALWALWPHKLNDLSNVIPRFTGDLPLLGVSPEVQNYSHGQISVGTQELFPMAVIAKRLFPRLVAQAGVFTVFHRLRVPLEQLGDGSHVTKYVIPADAHAAMRGELRRLNIKALSIFPELSRVAEGVLEIVRQ